MNVDIHAASVFRLSRHGKRGRVDAEHGDSRDSRTHQGGCSFHSLVPNVHCRCAASVLHWFAGWREWLRALLLSFLWAVSVVMTENRTHCNTIEGKNYSLCVWLP